MLTIPRIVGIDSNEKMGAGEASRYRRNWVGSESASGGSFSNTPPQISQLANPTGADDRVTGSEDTAVINLRMTWAETDEEFQILLDALEVARLAARASKTRTALFTWGGLSFEIAAKGANLGGARGLYLDYVLRSSGATVYIGASRVPRGKNGFNGRISFSSALLMAHDGLVNAWDFGKYLLAELGGHIQKNTLSRCDAAVDMGFDMSVVQAAYEARNFVSRVHKHSAIYEGSDRLETVYFGLTGMKCRIYDKIAESEGNAQKRAILAARRLFWGDTLTRVEFQLRREDLGQFHVDSVEDWFNMRSQITEYLTTKWLRFTDDITDRTHSSRVQGCTWWEDVRVAFALAFGADPETVQAAKPVHYLTMDPEALIRQALGCLAAAHVIVEKGTYDKVGEFGRWAKAKLLDAVSAVGYEDFMDGKSLRYMVNDVDIAHKMQPCPF